MGTWVGACRLDSSGHPTTSLGVSLCVQQHAQMTQRRPPRHRVVPSAGSSCLQRFDRIAVRNNACRMHVLYILPLHRSAGGMLRLTTVHTGDQQSRSPADPARDVVSANLRRFPVHGEGCCIYPPVLCCPRINQPRWFFFSLSLCFYHFYLSLALSVSSSLSISLYLLTDLSRTTITNQARKPKPRANERHANARTGAG